MLAWQAHGQCGRTLMTSPAAGAAVVLHILLSREIFFSTVFYKLRPHLDDLARQVEAVAGEAAAGGAAVQVVVRRLALHRQTPELELRIPRAALDARSQFAVIRCPSACAAVRQHHGSWRRPHLCCYCCGVRALH